MNKMMRSVWPYHTRTRVRTRVHSSIITILITTRVPVHIAIHVLQYSTDILYIVCTRVC